MKQNGIKWNANVKNGITMTYNALNRDSPK